MVATLRRNPVLVALEVDDAKLLLVSAALVTNGQAAGVVASAGALLDGKQRLVRLVRRQVVVDQLGREAEGRVIGRYVLIGIVFFAPSLLLPS